MLGRERACRGVPPRRTLQNRGAWLVAVLTDKNIYMSGPHKAHGPEDQSVDNCRTHVGSGDLRRRTGGPPVEGSRRARPSTCVWSRKLLPPKSAFATDYLELAAYSFRPKSSSLCRHRCSRSTGLEATRKRNEYVHVHVDAQAHENIYACICPYMATVRVIRRLGERVKPMSFEDDR